jgi:putative transposon-encoded protein
MVEFKLKGRELIEGTVKRVGNGAMVPVPKRLMGRKASVIIHAEEVDK